MEYLFSALLIGLFSSVHCVGMCGGISGALSYSLPPQVRERRVVMFTYILAYSAGRIASYGAAGALIGLVGEQTYDVLSPAGGYRVLQTIAAVLMTGIGLYVAGWFPRFARIERLGVPLWRRLEPLGRQLLPVRSPPMALLYGLVWGWLPCGLAYSALLMTVTAGGPLEGGSFMVAFGLGTLPAVVGMGMLAQTMLRLARRPRVRQAAGLLLVAMGLAGVLFAGQLHRFSPLSSQQENIDCTTR